MKGKILLLVSIIMILVGGVIANLVQNDFCKVKVRDVRFAGTGGMIMSGLLFIPKNATPKTPAPGILAIHGYINSRETQSGFAIEFARRGWVVLELDQSGHGYSDPPVGANAYGAFDGLAYLRTLDFVDKSRIGLEGHSMGGWASVIAAKVRPNDYRAMVLEGSSTKTKYSEKYIPVPGTTTFPKNLALVFSTYDEFSMLMWEVLKARDVVNSDALKKVFGVNEAIVPGKIYGSIEKGTARVLYQPKTTHPGDHLSQAAIGYAIEWFQKTLGGEQTLAPDKQIWYWKEIGTLIALIGAILLMFAAGDLMLKTGYFSSLKKSPQNPKPAGGAGWWISAVLVFLIPTVTYFPLTVLVADKWNASWLFPQKVTNNLVFWLVVNAVLSLIFFSVWHLASNKKKGGNGISYGLKTSSGLEWKKIGLSAWFALLVVATAYLADIASAFFFKTDFRLWVMALKPLSLTQFKIALRYIIPLALYYLMFTVVLQGQMRSPNASFKKRMIVSAVLGAGGYLLLLLLLYVPLLIIGMVPIHPKMTLYVIVAIQLLPLFIIVSLISTYFYEKTGQVYAGAFINAMFIVWYIVAGQVTSFPLL
ncbi:MAG: hypothetical protein A2W19_10280 [Spirochaetes bacterium RBG_16_49_21]|nr:MAG: hypothetical protein A2W19_10280 [Spirochaetes bacterium RBG_16_49_21]